MTRFLRKHWGWPALALTGLGWYGLVAGWFHGHVALALGVIALVSLTGAAHLLFREPLLWCGAANRDGTFCRNNASGALRGCNQVRQHKWQKVRMAFHPSEWGELNRSVFLGMRKTAVATGALVAFASSVAGIVSCLLAANLIRA